MLDSGMAGNIDGAPLVKASAGNVYFPYGGKKMDLFLADYHSNVIMGFFFATGIRYLYHYEVGNEADL